ARLHDARLEGRRRFRVADAQLDRDAARVSEAQQVIDVAGVFVARAAFRHLDAGRLEAGAEPRERVEALDLPAEEAQVVDHALTAVGLDEEARRPRVHAEREAAVAGALDELEAEDLGAEALPCLEIRDAEADVRELLDALGHRSSDEEVGVLLAELHAAEVLG